MDSIKPGLVEMWNAFAIASHIETINIVTLKEDQLIHVEVNHGDVLAAFDYEGHMEKALAERGMKIAKIGEAVGDILPLDVARL
jgi:hypothetical protein